MKEQSFFCIQHCLFGSQSAAMSRNHQKRKRDLSDQEHQSQPVQRRQSAPSSTLIAPHAPILSELRSKYNIVPISIISSSQIRKRVTGITTHLLASSNGEKPHAVLLHSRPGDVGKLITVTEQAKRVLKEEGKQWYQYNELFESPEREEKKQQNKNIVEETALEGVAAANLDEIEEEEDDFEVMESRLDKVLASAPSTRTIKSLRIILTVQPLPELRSRDKVTCQSSEEA